MPVPADPVFTLNDLKTWSRPGTSLAVLGYPIKQSISPAMQNAALAELARTDPQFASWRYFRFEVPPDDLPRALELFHEKKFHGLNLTVPHKIIAFNHMGEVDEAALPIGAVNTVHRLELGWRGFNTDGHGLAAAVSETLGHEFGGAHVVLLGAGGAARGAAIECLQRNVASLWIVNRTPTHLETLMEALSPFKDDIPVYGVNPHSLPKDLPTGALVINATSAGLKPDDAPPIDLTAWPKPAAIFDMIYNPPQTPLLRQAAALGLPHANGLSMLVHQGAKALEIWSGARASLTAPIMATAAAAAVQR